jgi:peroxiredoxin
LGHAVVGRCAEQKKDFSSVWHVTRYFLFTVLGARFYKVNAMRMLLVLLVIGLLGCEKKKQVQKEATVSVYKQQEVNQLPVMIMVDKDNNKTDASQLKGKNIIILFFPDCDHCKREAAEIADRIKSFDSYTIYFLSINPFEEILSFATTYRLSAIKNVKFVQTAGDAVYNNFGSVPTPSMYIYDDGKLVKKFNGETKVDEIIRFL